VTTVAEWASYVAVGDSFTEGLDDPLVDGTYRGWADLVATRLAVRRPDLRYANLAVRGRLLDAVIEEQVPLALEMAPDLVSFCAGGNDMLRPGFDLGRVHEKLDGVVGRFAAAGSHVVLFTAADVTTVLPGLLRRRVSALNDVIRVVAATHAASLVELWHHDGFRDARMWSEDRLHLSSYGHQRVASLVLDALGEECDPSWRAALPPLAPVRWWQARQSDVRWARQHLTPWLQRRLTGRSSGDTVRPKRPRLAPVYPADSTG
jgi:lysophospholipase L1-like esterase